MSVASKLKSYTRSLTNFLQNRLGVEKANGMNADKTQYVDALKAPLPARLDAGDVCEADIYRKHIKSWPQIKVVRLLCKLCKLW